MSIPLHVPPGWPGYRRLVGSCFAAAPASAASIWTEVPCGTTQNITAIEYQSAYAVLVHDRRRSDLQAPGRRQLRTGQGAGGVPLNDIEFPSGRSSASPSATAGSCCARPTAATPGLLSPHLRVRHRQHVRLRRPSRSAT